MEELWIFIILIFALTAVFITYFIEHSRLNNIWNGLVQEKKTKDYFYRGNHSYIYILQILKDNGEKLTIDVSEEMYKSIEVGDKVKKDKGQYYPSKDI
ncbi:hypothetical protein JK636_08680 [Clostridium sp. YIM B02515]|uniref:DUF7489 domain-containing protein n=1 Tax=Clostridium rhizosphaerae TaxID=2803861 RepID=A0ABS1T916_9CLOT|nr:hypothetical protein [Clostridium rhizosphaerae]MBL4935833.1 hypothetical protein [Clostridium rhizosphaerae]